MYRIGIDLGGTKIEGVVLDADGKVLHRERMSTDRERGYEHILGCIQQIHDNMVALVGDGPTTFGIGTPGALMRDGLLINSNTVCLNGKAIKADLEKLLGRKIEIENDANCFAMAEALLGAGQGRRLVFGVILGTGCGGGLVWDGHVIRGARGLAAEWGHHSIDPNGPLCFCGRRGCAETYISGGGMENRYAEQFGARKKLLQIEKEYGTGDPNAVKFIREFFQRFGHAFANLITFLDPDIIVLGGGVSKFSQIYTDGLAEVSRHVPNGKLQTPIVQNQLGDSAGVLGAALIGV